MNKAISAASISTPVTLFLLRKSIHTAWCCYWFKEGSIILYAALFRSLFVEHVENWTTWGRRRSGVGIAFWGVFCVECKCSSCHRKWGFSQGAPTSSHSPTTRLKLTQGFKTFYYGLYESIHIKDLYVNFLQSTANKFTLTHNKHKKAS